MKYLKLTSILIIYTLICLNASAKKELVEKKIDVKPFSEIEVSGYFNVNLVESNDYRLEIETKEDIHDNIGIDVKEKILIITLKDDNFKFKNKIYLTIYCKKFSKFTSNGMINLHTEESFKLGDVAIETNGVTKAHIELEAENLDVEVNGTGKIHLFGNSKNAKYTINGAGSINAYNMSVKNCNVEISGAGIAKIYVFDKLNATLTGVSKVYYKGEPKTKNTNCTFLSKVKKAEADK